MHLQALVQSAGTQRLLVLKTCVGLLLAGWAVVLRLMFPFRV